MKNLHYLLIIFLLACSTDKTEDKEETEINLVSRDGELMFKGTAINREFVGTWKEYFTNGQLQNISDLSDTEIEGFNGNQKRYYPSGNIEIETIERVIDEDWKYEYTYKYYYPNGVVYIESVSTVTIEYYENEREEIVDENVKYYRDNGSLVKIKYFSGDNIVKSENFDENGIIKNTVYFKGKNSKIEFH